MQCPYCKRANIEAVALDPSTLVDFFMCLDCDSVWSPQEAALREIEQAPGSASAFHGEVKKH